MYTLRNIIKDNNIIKCSKKYFLLIIAESEPCRGVQCSWGGLCSEEGGRPVCRCPRCPLRPSAPIRPVCGSDGRDYPSACELTKIACEQRLNATLVYNGKCGK